MNALLLAIGFGLVTSAIVALSAVAASLQFSVTPVPNFMHGEFLTSAAYAALIAQFLTGNILVALVAGVLVAALIAWVMDRVILTPFLRRGSPRILLLVATVAVGFVLQSTTAAVFGPGPQLLTIPDEWSSPNFLGPFILTDLDLAIIAAAIIAMFALHILLQYTKFGKAQRAVADNIALAAASGISTRRVVAITWLIVGGLAGLAGVLLAALQGSFDPFFGFNFLLVTLAAAIIGGIGRIYGAMIGALIIGLVTEISGAYLDASYKQVAALVVLIVALMLRPQGLLTAVRETEQVRG